MNPCPFGYYGDPTRNCTCPSPAIQRYLARVSGPFLDRIDIHIDVPAINFKELSSDREGETSAVIRERVQQARKVQLCLFEKEKDLFSNADMQPAEIRKYCRIDEAGQQLLKNAINKFGFSARAYDRILKVSRTIADLENSDNILPAHLSEAIQYRTLDRDIWN